MTSIEHLSTSLADRYVADVSARAGRDQLVLMTNILEELKGRTGRK